MTGRRRLAGAGLEGNQAQESTGKPRTYEPSSAGKTNPATSCFQEELKVVKFAGPCLVIPAGIAGIQCHERQNSGRGGILRDCIKTN